MVSGSRILIVDDDPVALRVTTRLLEGVGAEVSAVGTGAEGLSMAEELEPDLILLDVGLPDTDGREVCRLLRANKALGRPQIIIASASQITSDDQAEGLDCGADGYIALPVPNRELLARIEASLRIRYAEKQAASLARFPDENPNPVLRVSREGVLLYANEAADPLLQVWGIGAGLKLPGPLWEQMTAALAAEHTATVDVACEGRLFALAFTPIAGKDYFNVYGTDVTELRRADLALRTSEVSYRRLFEAAQDGILLLNADTGAITDVNPFLSDLLGHPGSWLIGKKLWEIGPLSDVVASQDSFAELQRDSYIRYENLPLQTASGRRIQVEFVSNAYDAGGDRVIQCNIRDLTSRQQAQDEIRRLNRLLGTLSDANQAIVRAHSRQEMLDEICRVGIERGGFALVAVSMVAQDGDHVEAVAQHGRDDGYLVSRNVVLSEPDQNAGPVGQALLTGEPQVSLDIGEDARMAPWREAALARGFHALACLPLRLDGRVVGTLDLYADGPEYFDAAGLALLDEMAADVSFALQSFERERRRKESEQELRASEERYRVLVEASPDAIALISPDRKIIVANRTMARLHGFDSPEQMVGLDPLRLSAPDELARVLSSEQAMATTGEAQRMECRLQRHDGSSFPGELTIAGVFGPSGALDGILTIARDITNRKLAEDALRESEARHRAVFEQTSIGMALTALDGTHLDCNQALLDMLGLTKDEFLGMRAEEFTHPDDRNPDATLWDELEAGKRTSYQRETRYLSKDGRVVWARLTVSMAMDGQGRRTAAITAVEDITDAKRADELLRASEQRFRELTDLLPQSVYECDLDGRLTFANRQAFTEFGYLEEDLRHGLALLDMLVPEDRERALEATAETIGGRATRTYEFTAVRKDGSTFPVLVSSSLVLRDGQRTGLRGIVVNITDQRLAEELLRSSRRTAWALLNATHEIALLVDADETVLAGNAAAAQSLGVPMNQLVGRRVEELLPPEIAARRIFQMQRVVATGAPVSFEDQRGDRVFANTIVPVSDDEGIVAQLAVFGQDVTDLRRAEDSARMASIGQLAAGVAHDFNNLLGGMMMRAELLEFEYTEKGARELVGTVLKSGRRGAEICKNLMGFARPDEPRREPAFIEAALEAALAVAARQMEAIGISVSRDYAAEGRRVHVDAGQMEQVLLNLIINATHAMPNGGALALSTRYDADANQAIVTVSDTGTGIAPEHLPHIFDPFFTTKGRLGESDTPGSGLGLSVSHGIVTAHGGTITVRSEPGVGTTFQIALPLAPPDVFATLPSAGSASAAAGAAAVGLASTEGCSVLVMDDDRDFLDLLSRALTKRGIRMVSAISVAEALEELGKDRFSLVLADVRMPGGGAADLLTKLSSAPEAPPVLAMTGAAPGANADALVALGAIACIQKPHSLAEMVGIVEDHLQSCRRRDVEDVAGSSAPAGASPRPPVRVLLADDEESIRAPIVEALTARGYVVIESRTAGEAAEALCAGHFDLVITDLLMPGGGARAILAALADRDPRPAVLVITGKLEQYITDDLVAAGAACCLQKPFALTQLLHLVAEVLPEDD